MNISKKVIVGMSGGVDSAVAAYLLLQQGYAVEGLFMKNWEEDDDKEYCSAEVDLADALQVSNKLGIKLHTVNFATEYWDNVFAYFLKEYKAGRTPNPDVMCNTEIKFKAFLDHAITLGADHIATGHYVRSSHTDGVKLLRGLDNNKDQSYFLYRLTQQQLAPALFPVGEMEKAKVRAIAKEQGFDNNDKKDSTGICFIGERKFKDFLARFLPAEPGNIETTEGDIIGRHSGLMYHTLGQRQGLGIGGTKDGNNAPWFVLQKDLTRNVLVAGQGHDHKLLLHDTVIASQLHLIGPHAKQFSCVAKTRYRQPDQACDVGIDGDEVLIKFVDKQRAITPGQSVVFYRNNECLGGAIIDTFYNREETTL
jgi:tRNA-specific 2-thiouridylase